ncbi:MAG: family 20 glycosylhydrolase, partial [Pseudomonadales bacterium]|nr:family 20 glycosylhydrolase [Pseudomonadales bacterium]
AFHLYPPPKRFRQHKSELSLENRRWIVLDRNLPERIVHAANRFADDLPRPAEITFGEAPADQTLVSLQLRPPLRNTEAYEIRCNAKGISIDAASEAGLFYGLGTLGQILAQAADPLPCFSIRDEPDFPNRGVMLDISRCKVAKLETLFDQIDAFARLKYNQLQLYTEHTFAFVNHPTVWADASPLTAGDIARIRQFCEARYIDLVPNLNSFGHFERWLRHPEYQEYAECPDGFVHPLSGQRIEFGSTLRPTRKSLALLEALYDEYLPLFNADAFNVGGDEPWELGQGYSRRQCEARGTTGVYVDFLGEIHKLVRTRDRTMMFWSDIVLKEPDSLRKLGDQVIALNWGYEGNHPFKKECEIMNGAGLPYYVCPGTSAWNSLVGRTSNMLTNLASAARNGLKFDATGYLVTDWGDHGHHQYLPVSFSGFVMGGCHAWHHRASRQLDPADGVNRIFLENPDSALGNLIVDLGLLQDLNRSNIRHATLFTRRLF